MSGIYIKAFKAPTSCWDCWGRGLKSLVGCTAGLTYSNRDDMGIASANCKIISVPDHGRLGDLDMVQSMILEYIEEYGTTRDENGFYSEKWCAMKEAEMVIQDAPTVIPADRKGE